MYRKITINEKSRLTGSGLPDPVKRLFFSRDFSLFYILVYLNVYLLIASTFTTKNYLCIIKTCNFYFPGRDEVYRSSWFA